MKRKYIVVLLLLLVVTGVMAQKTVKLLDGRTVILNANGTWAHEPATKVSLKLSDGRNIILNNNGTWTHEATIKTQLKLPDGRTVIIKPDGTWEHEAVAIEPQELTTADGTQIIATKKGRWVTKPLPPEYGTMKDARDKKVYKTVKIGNQWWMAENLSYKAVSGCWPSDNIEKNVAKYGRLYSWETAKTACPAGWHLPSDEEWTILTNYLGGPDVAGGYMKSMLIWQSPNVGATNSSGFNALPAGERSGDGLFFGLGSTASFWASASVGNQDAWRRSLDAEDGGVGRGSYGRTGGFSIRCIKD